MKLRTILGDEFSPPTEQINFKNWGKRLKVDTDTNNTYVPERFQNTEDILMTTEGVRP